MTNNMASGGSSGTKRREGMPMGDDARRKKVRKSAKFEWEIFYNLAARAYPGWENVP